MRRSAHVGVSGFTLLEIMVVLLLIGLMAAVVVVTNRGSNAGADLEKESQRFARVIRMAQEEAMLSGQLVAMVIEPNQYRFFYAAAQSFSAENINEAEVSLLQIDLSAQVVLPKWQPLEKALFEPYTLPKHIRLQMSIDGIDWAEQEEESKLDLYRVQANDLGESQEEQLGSRNTPVQQLLIFPSGEQSSFRLTLEWEKDTEYHKRVMISDTLGRMSMESNEAQ